MNEYIKGNLGIVKINAIEGMVIKRYKVYAICKEKEILINESKNIEEARLFLDECMKNMEEKVIFDSRYMM